jgi:pimeloyl-ACP methyl ester carboxylesterase
MKWVSNKQWIIAGNSIGGLCSLGVAEQLPDLVRAIVLFNCVGGMTGFRYEDVPMMLRPLLYFLRHVVLGPSLGGCFFANFKTREENVESILMSQGVYRNETNVNAELLETLLGPTDDEGAQDVFLKTFFSRRLPVHWDRRPNPSCPILNARY